MANNDGTLVIAPIRPFSDADEFPSAYAGEVKGGHHSVPDLDGRNAITVDRREEGMLCTVLDATGVGSSGQPISGSFTYQLLGGIDDGDWELFQSGASQGDIDFALSEYVTQPELDAVESNLQGQIDNLDAGYITESEMEGISGYLQDGISSLGTSTSGITGGVSQLDDRFVNVDGDTMTGDLVVDGNVTISSLASISGDNLTVDQNGKIVGASPFTITDNTRVVYLSDVGNDSDDGLSIDQPKATIDSAITAASALTPTLTDKVVIHILDGAQYTVASAGTQLTIPENVVVYGPSAEIVHDRSVILEDNTAVCLRRMYGTTFSNVIGVYTFIIDSGATGNVIIKVDEIEVGGKFTGCISNESSAIVYVFTEKITTTSNNNGILNDSTGEIKLNAQSISVIGSPKYAIANTNASGKVTGYVNEINGGGIGIDVDDGIVDLSIQNLTSTTAYDVESGATLNLIVHDVTGTETNDGTVNIIKVNDIGDLQTRLDGITGGTTQLDNTYVNVTGDTMTGPLSIVNDGQSLLLGTGGLGIARYLQVRDSNGGGAFGYDANNDVGIQTGSARDFHIKVNSSLSSFDLSTPNFKIEADGTATFKDDVVVGGDLTINGNVIQISGGGYFTQIAETVQIQDNLVVLNYGETGNGISLNQSGVQVDRGTAQDYFFMFDETIDGGTFAIGTSGNLQPVATREVTPDNGAFAYWDESDNRFVTSTAYTSGSITDLRTDVDSISSDLANFSTDFLGLTDTPSSYAGSDTHVVTVSSGELVFTPQSEIIPTLTEETLSGALDGRYVNVTGDTMTGPLTITGGDLDVQGEISADTYKGLGLPITTFAGDGVTSNPPEGTPFSSDQTSGTIIIDTTLGNVDFTIQDANTENFGDVLKFIKTGGNTAIIQTSGGENIGATTEQEISDVDLGKGFTIMNNDGDYLIVQDNRFNSVISSLESVYVNVTGDTMTGTLTMSGGANFPTLITSDDNVTQVNVSGDLISTELQELYVAVEDISGSDVEGEKGQWSYGQGYKYEAIGTDTWVKHPVIIDVTSNIFEVEDLKVTNLASISGNVFTTDSEGNFIDSGIAVSELQTSGISGNYVDVTGDTMSGPLVITDDGDYLLDVQTTSISANNIAARMGSVGNGILIRSDDDDDIAVLDTYGSGTTLDIRRNGTTAITISNSSTSFKEDRGLTIGGTDYVYDATLDTHNFNSDVIMNAPLTTTDNISAGGNIIPTISGGYDLGSAAFPWRDLYVTSNTINMGGVALSILNGKLAVGGDEVVTISGGNGAVNKYTEVIGDGSTNPITVTHGLGTRAVTYSIAETSSPWGVVDADISLPTTNTMEINFTTAPISGGYEVTIIG